MRERGIGIGVHYAPVHLFRYYRERFGYRAGQFPAEESLGARIVSLPLFPGMRETDLERVVAALREAA
jgi:dTDP-4-amino-4,6-dideoxygalactose transaminase